MARLGKAVGARRGMARQGEAVEAWPGAAGHGRVWCGGRGMVRSDGAGHGWAVGACCGDVSRFMARYGGQGMARPGESRPGGQGTARQGKSGRGKPVNTKPTRGGRFRAAFSSWP